jgi:hypothetical protein
MIEELAVNRESDTHILTIGASVKNQRSVAISASPVAVWEPGLCYSAPLFTETSLSKLS